MAEETTNNTQTPADAADNGSPREAAVTVYPFSDFSYDQGFADGAMKLRDLPHYESFATSLEKKQLAEQLLARCRYEKQRLEAEIAQIKQKTVDLYRTVFDKEGFLVFAKTRLEEYLAERERLKEEVHQLYVKRSEIKSESTVVVGLMMLLAGFVFICSDVLITQGLLQKGLSMPRVESWILAVSLSLTAFAIKPAFDRIFEKPYIQHGKIKRNHSMLLVLSGLVVIMLGVLGWIRGDSFLILLKIDMETPDYMNEWMALLARPHITFLFVLASILFALVGALCLSIGFRNMQKFVKRYELRNESKESKRYQVHAENRIYEMRDLSYRAKKDLEISKKEIELLPLLRHVEIKLANLSQEEKELLTHLAEANATAQSSWYKEGAARGEQFRISGELFVSPIRMERLVAPDGLSGYIWRGETGTKPPPNGTSVKPDTSIDNRTVLPGDYLYQQIRNAIAIHDNKTNKKFNTNGKMG